MIILRWQTVTFLEYGTNVSSLYDSTAFMTTMKRKKIWYRNFATRSAYLWRNTFGRSARPQVVLELRLKNIKNTPIGYKRHITWVAHVTVRYIRNAAGEPTSKICIKMLSFRLLIRHCCAINCYCRKSFFLSPMYSKPLFERSRFIQIVFYRRVKAFISPLPLLQSCRG